MPKYYAHPQPDSLQLDGKLTYQIKSFATGEILATREVQVPFSESAACSTIMADMENYFIGLCGGEKEAGIKLLGERPEADWKAKCWI